MIQAVIDIAEKKYKSRQDGSYCGILSDDLYYAIKNSTPLPSEYKVYHSGSDYWWRGVRCTLDAIEGVKE